MEPARALEVDPDLDLKLFCAYLWQTGVAHRVYEERGRQVLEVANAGDVPRVRAEFEAWRLGALRLRPVPSTEPRGSDAELADFATLGSLLGRYPVLIALGLLALLCLPVTSALQREELTMLLNAMLIVDVAAYAPEQPARLPMHVGPAIEAVVAESRVGLLVNVLVGAEIWRFVTPALLHFGVTHLAFNLVAIAIFGRPIERGAGGLTLLWIVLVIAVVSNVAQFLVSGNPLFGGLSGVAYGLFGFVAARSWQAPDHAVWSLNPAFTIVFLVMLVLMTTGITEPFGLYIAHAAHWGGLITGAALALLLPLERDMRSERADNDNGFGG
jgi:GlpG protein